MKRKSSIALITFAFLLVLSFSSCADSMCPTFTQPIDRIGMSNYQMRSYKERSSVPSPHSAKYKNKLVKKFSRL